MCLIDPFHSHNASWEPLRKPENTASTQETHKHNQAEGMAYQHPWWERECYCEVMVETQHIDWLNFSQMLWVWTVGQWETLYNQRFFLQNTLKHKNTENVNLTMCLSAIFGTYIICGHFYFAIEEADSVDHISGQSMLVRQSVVWGATTDHWPQPAIDPSLN